jgi:ABC-type lipoprotein release transport system permease subunit
MIIALSWKNLWRNRRRSLITMSAIAFGIFLAVTMNGIATHMYGKLIDASVRLGLGHVSFQAAGYQADPTLKKRLPGAHALAAQIAQRPEVAAALPRIQGAAMFSTANKSVGGIFMALDPTRESAETHLLLKAVTQGRAIADPQGRGALVGERMAQRLGLKLGRKLVLTFNDAHGQMSTAMFRVEGLFKSGVDEVDGSTVLLPLGSAADMLGYADGDASAVAVLLKDARDSGAASRRLGQDLGRPDAEVLSWQDTLPQLAGMMRVDRAFDYLFQMVLGLVIAVGVLNTALMSVMERRREMGVMLAVGLSPERLFALMLAESTWLGLLGLALGGAVSLPWYWYLAHTGLDFSSMMPPEGVAMGGVLMEPVYYAQLFWPQVALIAAVAIGLSCMAGLLPAWKAARVPPLESIRDL